MCPVKNEFGRFHALLIDGDEKGADLRRGVPRQNTCRSTDRLGIAAIAIVVDDHAQGIRADLHPRQRDPFALQIIRQHLSKFRAGRGGEDEWLYRRDQAVLAPIRIILCLANIERRRRITRRGIPRPFAGLRGEVGGQIDFLAREISRPQLDAGRRIVGEAEIERTVIPDIRDALVVIAVIFRNQAQPVDGRIVDDPPENADILALEKLTEVDLTALPGIDLTRQQAVRNLTGRVLRHVPAGKTPPPNTEGQVEWTDPFARDNVFAGKYPRSEKVLNTDRDFGKVELLLPQAHLDIELTVECVIGTVKGEAGIAETRLKPWRRLECQGIPLLRIGPAHSGGQRGVGSHARTAGLDKADAAVMAEKRHLRLLGRNGEATGGRRSDILSFQPLRRDQGTTGKTRNCQYFTRYAHEPPSTAVTEPVTTRQSILADCLYFSPQACCERCKTALRHFDNLSSDSG